MSQKLNCATFISELQFESTNLVTKFHHATAMYMFEYMKNHMSAINTTKSLKQQYIHKTSDVICYT